MSKSHRLLCPCMLLIASSARRSYHSTGPKLGVSESLNPKRLSFRKKLSSRRWFPDTSDCVSGKSGYKGVASTTLSSRPELGTMPRLSTWLVFEATGSAIAGLVGTLLGSRALNVRDLWGLVDFSGYEHSRPTLSQFLQRGKVSSHLTRLLRHVRLRSVSQIALLSL
jgi:hypothetical protein